MTPRQRRRLQSLPRLYLFYLFLQALLYHCYNITKRNKYQTRILLQAALSLFVYYNLPHHPLSLPTAIGLTTATSLLFQTSVSLVKPKWTNPPRGIP